MPDGIVHGKATLGLAVITAMAWAWLDVVDLFNHGALGCAFVAGQLTGLILDPDLDVDHRTESERRVEESLVAPGFALFRRGNRLSGAAIVTLGRILGKVWRWYWLPYALLAKHRGVSHWLAVGTLTRVAWLSPVLLGLWLAFGRPDVQLLFAGWLAGLVMADALHTAMDWVF